MSQLDSPLSKRLHIVPDRDYREIQRSAQSRGMSIAEWVRQALDLARSREPASITGKKIDAVRTAVRHACPTGDVDTVLAELESGYGTGASNDPFAAREGTN
jgi:hypothetical protein